MLIATSSPRKFKIGAWIIKKYQRTEFSHVLIIKDDLVYQASNGLVHACHVDVFHEENKIINLYEVEDIRINFDYVKRQLGKKYGYFQLFKIALNVIFGLVLPSNGDKKLICSELVSRALGMPTTDYTTPLDVDKVLKKISINNKWGKNVKSLF